MDDEVDTVLMKKQNMPDTKVIDFFNYIRTSDFRGVSNFQNVYVCSHRIIKFHLANFHVNRCL